MHIKDVKNVLIRRFNMFMNFKEVMTLLRNRGVYEKVLEDFYF